MVTGLAVAAIAAGAFGGWWYVEKQGSNWYKPPPEVAHVPSPAPEASKPVKPPEPQPAQQEKAAPEPQPAPQTNTALVTKPPEPAPPAPSQIVTRAAEIISFINGYDGGDCFFAAPEVIADGNASIVGYSNRPEPFERFLAAFRSKAGFEPNIRLSNVSDGQCPVVGALKALSANPGRPQLHLDKDVVPVGGSLEGTVTVPAGQDVRILLVDHEGVVQNLRSAKNAVTRSGDSISFKIRLSAQQQLQNSGEGAYLPMLIVSVGSTKAIQSLASIAPVLASELMPKLVAETRKSGDISATTGYFKLIGPKS